MQDRRRRIQALLTCGVGLPLIAGCLGGATPAPQEAHTPPAFPVCDFPPEFPDGRLAGEAVVRVFVGADGYPLRVDVLSDTGHGIGRAAAECAMKKRYSPALDDSGNPIPDSLDVRIRFERPPSKAGTGQPRERSTRDGSAAPARLEAAQLQQCGHGVPAVAGADEALAVQASAG